MRTALATSALALALVASTSMAATIYSENFNSLTAGPIVGQGTWDVFPNNATTIAAGVVSSGGLVVNTSPLTATTFYYNPVINQSVANQVVTASADVTRLPNLDPADPLIASAFRVGLFNPSGALLAYVGLSATGNLNFNDAAGATQTVTLSSPVAYNQTVNLKLIARFDPVTANRTVTYEINGVAVPAATGALTSATGDSIGDFDFYAVPLGYDAARYDNALVTTAPIPEPTTLAGIAGVAMLALRRRK
jgi:hypothetical protein